MVKVVQGHVLKEYNATLRITDWFDGQSAHYRGEAPNKLMIPAYIAGYKAPYGTLPPDAPLAERELAKKLTYP
ncbi:MAG: hypothetical protein WBQ25_12950 [Nitrososphaeraceae archaeon]